MMKNKYLVFCLISLILSMLMPIFAQSGGTFVIQKSVIAGGGGNSTGAAFVLDGTIAEAVAGATSSGGVFQLGGGFWGGGATASTSVTVSGRVLTSDGRGLRNATVSITDPNGVSRIATTSSFGFFSFDNVSAGGAYTFRIFSRFFRFQPRTVQVNDNLTLADFMGLE